MGKRQDESWPGILLDSWMLGAEAWLVVGLRTARLVQADDTACREARLMVSEKVDSGVELTNALVAGQLGSDVKTVLARTTAHYLRGVRANRKRLSRG